METGNDIVDRSIGGIARATSSLEECVERDFGRLGRWVAHGIELGGSQTQGLKRGQTISRNDFWDLLSGARKRIGRGNPKGCKAQDEQIGNGRRHVQNPGEAFWVAVWIKDYLNVCYR